MLPKPCLTPCALCAWRTHLGLQSLSTSDPPELRRSSGHLVLTPSESPRPSSTLSRYSYQSLVWPMCNRQVVNLPAGLVISSLPLRHVQTPVGVTFMTHTSYPSDLPWTSFCFTSNSCQSLVQPMCNRQVVNLPARLNFFVLPSQHVWTLVGVHL